MEDLSAHRWTLEDLKTQAPPLAVFGAGVVGEAVVQLCRGAGVPVACFCDNSKAKAGTFVAKLPVLLPSELSARFPNAAVLVAVADIQDVVAQLGGLGLARWGTCHLLEDADLNVLQLDRPAEYVRFAVEACLTCHQSYLHPEKLFLRSVDVIITERCSLRCRDCSNLMQYYERPVDCDPAVLDGALEVLLGAIDEVNDLRVIGGEPLMNRDCHRVVARLSAHPKVKRVAVYTNGTIVPRPEQWDAFRNPKAIFLITDYGDLSRNLVKLTESLKREGVAFFVHRATAWAPCSGISRHGRTPGDLHQVFAQCCAKNLLTLADDRLYRCPFLANAARLRAVPDLTADYVQLRADAVVTEMRRRLREFVQRDDYMEGCDWCEGRPWNAAEVTPAVQAPKPLPYRTA
jgi:hypothetical protein